MKKLKELMISPTPWKQGNDTRDLTAMKEKDSICDECATRMGYEPDDKSVGMWVAKCDFCGKKKWLTSLSNDWHKKEASNG